MKTKNYIVVKTFEEMETLISVKNPPKELQGKIVIVAPGGLKFVSKEDISQLPQVKELLLSTYDKCLEIIYSIKSRMLAIGDISMSSKNFEDNLIQDIEREKELIISK